MINRIYFIIDKITNKVVETRKNWAYESLGAAKTAARLYIDYRNRKSAKIEKLKYENYSILECELVAKEVHKLS